MSLNYGTLKTQILADTHRTELTGEVANFVRAAEGVIARRLRCSEMLTRVDLTDSDRVTADEGFYTLPTDYLEARALFLIQSAEGDIMLEPVSLMELRRYSSSSKVRQYTIITDTEVELRGVPSTTQSFELIYFARPTAFAADGDVNDILTRHEAVYLHAGISALYQFTQDLELSAAHGQIAIDAIEALNEQAGRMIGGNNTAGYYDFNSWGGR